MSAIQIPLIINACTICPPASPAPPCLVRCSPSPTSPAQSCAHSWALCWHQSPQAGSGGRSDCWGIAAHCRGGSCLAHRFPSCQARCWLPQARINAQKEHRSAIHCGSKECLPISTMCCGHALSTCRCGCGPMGPQAKPLSDAGMCLSGQRAPTSNTDCLRRLIVLPARTEERRLFIEP